MNINVSDVPSRARLYRDLALVLSKHGGRFLAEKSGWATLNGDSEEKTREGEVLAEDLEELGPTFVKLGQLLSTRSDMFTAETVESLERLQSDVEPVPYDEICQVFQAELQNIPERVFKSFEREPLASASLGQVHRATMHSGEEVIVKIQRPGIQERVQTELEVLTEVCSTLENHSEDARKHRLSEIVRELRFSLERELDYRLEMENLRCFDKLLKNSDLLFVPEPIPRLTTRKVLTMEYVVGDKLPKTPIVGHSSGPALADELFRAYLEHVLIQGEFHADPHPGNLLITPGGRICLLDLGMIGSMPKSLQLTLARMLIAVVDKDGEQVAETALDVSGRAENSDPQTFRRDISSLVSEYHRRPLMEMQAGELIMEIVSIASNNGIWIPYELTMLAKTLMNLDDIGRRLDPDFNPTAALERHVGPILKDRLKQDYDPKLLLNAYMEARTFLKDGPRLANNILRDLENGSFAIRVDAVDERELLVSFQKIANRIGMSLVIGALILGASLLMSADVGGPTIFGYPAFAMVCFLLAAGGGSWTMWNVYKQDRTSKKELNRPLAHRG